MDGHILMGMGHDNGAQGKGMGTGIGQGVGRGVWFCAIEMGHLDGAGMGHRYGHKHGDEDGGRAFDENKDMTGQRGRSVHAIVAGDERGWDANGERTGDVDRHGAGRI